MSLRPAEPRDATPLAALSVEVWLATYVKRGVTPEFADYALSAHRPERFEALIAAQSEHLIVSENAEGIDGYVRLTEGAPCPVGDSMTEISTLYVQPRHHGGGRGAALLQAALDKAAELGAPSIWLTTNDENTPAIGFYLAQGFERIGQTHFTLGDAAYPNDVFLKQITGS